MAPQHREQHPQRLEVGCERRRLVSWSRPEHRDRGGPVQAGRTVAPGRRARWCLQASRRRRADLSSDRIAARGRERERQLQHVRRLSVTAQLRWQG